VATRLLHPGLTVLRLELAEVFEDVEGYEGEFQVLRLN
jgi:hypothetical protein